MSSVIQANTLTVGAGSTTNVASVLGSGGGPCHVIIRASASGVKMGGADLDSLGYGFNMVVDKDYEFDLRPFGNDYPASSAEGSLYVKNTTGSPITVTYFVTALTS